MSDAKSNKTLPLFYRAVLGWIINPAHNPHEFSTDYGLCDNLEYQYAPGRYDLFTEQRDLFRSTYMSAILPFGDLEQFCNETSSHTVYRNHERVSFVVEQVVSPELRRNVELLHGQLLRGQEVTDSLCFLPGNQQYDRRVELRELFQMAGLDITYPFDQKQGEGLHGPYYTAMRDGTLYKNPLRLHFVSVLAGQPGTLDHLAAK